MAGYRIPHQQEGTRVSWWPDPRGPGHPPHHWGTIIQHIGDTVQVIWDDDDDFYETWTAAEMRYRIDRGQLRLKAPPKKRRVRLSPDELICKVCGKPRQLKCGCPRPGATKPEEWGLNKLQSALTRANQDDSMLLSLKGHRAPNDETKGVTTMAKTKTKEVEVKESPLSAKEAAAAIGTDARTLRKFLRSRSGLIGQGNRWEIDPDEVDELKEQFEAWGKGKAARAEKATKPPVDDDEVDTIDADDELEEITDDDLEDLDFDD